MAAAATQNPAVRSESKSAKKKKTKTETATETQTPSTPEVALSNSPADAANGDGTDESPYIKELQKNIRNINKKIANASKVDNILAENPDKSLDDLVASKKINADQKAQILKKPALQASLTQLEEQVAQYKKFDQEHKTKAQSEKAELERTLRESANKELEETVTSLKKEAQASVEKAQGEGLLLVSQFLRLAAVRRSEEYDAELEENKALEGLLAVAYAGNSAAVSTLTKLIKGSNESVDLGEGQQYNVTYADIKALAVESVPAQVEEATIETAAVEDLTPAADTLVQSDPTIANAGLTEIDAETTAFTSQQTSNEPEGVPQNAGFGDGANAAAEANWDNNNDLSASQEWVQVQRDATETENGLTATPAAPTNTQSWADDQPESPNEKTSAPPANKDDGFHEVQRNKGQNRNQGGHYRGRGGRGGGEGRGRGNYRGRGEGRGRGGRGGRRPENDS